MNEDRTLGFEDALVVVRDLADGYAAATGRIVRLIVAVGARLWPHTPSASAPETSTLYVSDHDDDVLDRVRPKHHGLPFFEPPARSGFSSTRSAGAGDEILTVMDTLPDETADMAAQPLKQQDPARHLERRAAVRRLRRPTDR